MTDKTTTIPPAASPTAPQHGLIGSFTPILLMILVFYFLIMRPQQKREAKRRELISSIKKGDKILTSCGIIGVVHKVVNEKEISLEISENVRVRVLRSSITEILGKNSDLGAAESDVSTTISSNNKKAANKNNESSKK
ncbi:MAG: preprotein translocase subunit YajC [Holosporaceae bacterium]|jgi:preprotein translocase subunit YajC|nr:preprotein translocase subunit YajC [Holosporaceae bacterium]